MGVSGRGVRAVSGRSADESTDGLSGVSVRPSLSQSRVGRLYARRMRWSIVSVLSVPLLFALAPLQLSMPFALVALTAPLLTARDCRRTHQHSSSNNCNSNIGDAGRLGEAAQQRAAGALRTTEAHKLPVVSHVDGAMQHSEHTLQQQPRQPQPQLQSHAAAGQSSQASSGVSAVSPSLSLIRSEERLLVRKERVVSSKVVLRKVVYTEMVLLSVPVRRERLEVETVQLDPPLVLQGDENEQGEQAAGTGSEAEAAVAPGGSVDVLASGGVHDRVGVDAAGRPTIELLLSEERPRVVYDIVPVSRVTATKTAYAASQLVDMELSKEHFQFVAPSSSADKAEQLW